MSTPADVLTEDDMRRPMMGCGYVDQRDGCCTHPLNPTPECHADIVCPVLVIRVQGGSLTAARMGPWGDGSTPIPLEPEPFHATDTLEAMRARVHTVFSPGEHGRPHEWQEDSCFCYVGADHDAGQEQLEPPHPDDVASDE